MNMHPAAKAPPSAADNKSFQPEKKAMTMQSLSTTTTELKPVELQSYLDEGWRIFVDTCSFMSSGCEPFFTRSAAAFRDAGVSIHCPKEVRRELEKNLSSPKEQTRQLAMRGLAAYDALDKLDVLREIDCPGSQENVFADPVFAKIFDEQRAEHKLLLITQDRRLAAGLYSRNQDEFMHFHPVHVLRLLSRGDLGFLNHPQTQELMFPPNMNDFSRQSVPMIRAHLVSSEAVPPAGRSVPRTVSAGRTGDVREASRPEKESVSKVVSKPAVPAVEKAAPALHAAFPVCTSVIDLEDRPVGIDRAPVEGDVVCDEFGMTHTLGRRLGEGGEGIVYDAGNGMVAKIYHADKCTTRREAKVRLLASRPIRLKGVCAPQRMLFSNGFFAGCLMPEAKGFGLEGPLDKCFAGWSRADLAQLAVTILKTIGSLHRFNVLVGDVNLSNIRVVSPDEAYLIDCDSVQVANLPCPVGHEMYTAPEIRGRDFSTFLRSKSSENHAVAALIFMLLMPDEDLDESGKYRLGARRISSDPFLLDYPGFHRGEPLTLCRRARIWSHLPDDLKSAFGRTFDSRGNLHAEADRLGVAGWILRLNAYRERLLDGTLLADDPLANEIYPKTGRKILPPAPPASSAAGRTTRPTAGTASAAPAFRSPSACSPERRSAPQALPHLPLRRVSRRRPGPRPRQAKTSLPTPRTNARALTAGRSFALRRARLNICETSATGCPRAARHAAPSAAPERRRSNAGPTRTAASSTKSSTGFATSSSRSPERGRSSCGSAAGCYTFRHHLLHHKVLRRHAVSRIHASIRQAAARLLQKVCGRTLRHALPHGRNAALRNRVGS